MIEKHFWMKERVFSMKCMGTNKSKPKKKKMMSSWESKDGKQNWIMGIKQLRREDNGIIRKMKRDQMRPYRFPKMTAMTQYRAMNPQRPHHQFKGSSS
jgi:hypothetical protein